VTCGGVRFTHQMPRPCAVASLPKAGPSRAVRLSNEKSSPPQLVRRARPLFLIPAYMLHLAVLFSHHHIGEIGGEVWGADMHFEGELPSAVRALGGNLWQIFATGPIDSETPQQLERFIRDNDIPERSLIYLDSRGGSLKGGMELGRVIRSHRLLTNIGRKGGTLGSPPFTSIEVELGECYSACALAFLGGEYRFLAGPPDPAFVDIVLLPLLGERPSLYGVHRFSSAQKSRQDGEIAQVISAQIVQYIRDMDVDPELFSFMTRAGPDEINLLWEPDLVRLNVINNGRKRARWTIESHEGIYVKGEQETWRGMNKFIIVCGKKGALLTIMFHPEGHQEKILKELTAYQLQLDDERVPMDNHCAAPAIFHNGLIIGMFGIDEHLLQRITNATTVGFFFQRTHDSPEFAGFRSMPALDGGRKLRGLMTSFGIHSATGQVTSSL
jgi:hypothetical protein